MSLVTIRVLEGLERGRVFSDLPTPVSIGREDDNDIQLNDDRVSRFHAKLQDDGGRVILTDLDSTNGTRVNGHPVQMKVLQPGDLVTIGRCVLLFSPTDDQTMAAAGDGEAVESRQTSLWDADGPPPGDVDFISPPAGMYTEAERLFPHGAPPLPEELRPLQRAQISDLLAYFHEQLGLTLEASLEDPQSPERDMRCPRAAWNHLTSLQATLAMYLRKMADPD